CVRLSSTDASSSASSVGRCLRHRDPRKSALPPHHQRLESEPPLWPGGFDVLIIGLISTRRGGAGGFVAYSRDTAGRVRRREPALRSGSAAECRSRPVRPAQTPPPRCPMSAR